MGTVNGKAVASSDKRNNNYGDPDRHDGFLVDPDLEEQDITGSRNRTISDNWEAPEVELNPELQKASLQKDQKLRTLPAVFRWHEPCKSVYIVCSADNWQKKHYLQLDKVDAKNSSRHESVYLTIIELPEGRHEYRYVVDGVDRHNPKEKTVENLSGGLNHVLRVREEDFEALDALLMDAAAEKPDSDSEYGQVEPKMLTPMEAMKARNQPPALPSHLLHKILLNQETSLAVDPSLLPEPSVSQLNHLYALSIRDNTLAISATHRFRGRFVTTLLYKPIEPPPSRSRNPSTRVPV